MDDLDQSVPNDETEEIVVSKAPKPSSAAIELTDVLQRMGETYRANSDSSVRDSTFIKQLHDYLGSQLESRLTRYALRTRKVRIVKEAKILGSIKAKKVDLAVVDPENGPLVVIGIRSQMSSIGNNVLGYYEGLVGECISLQDRFPMATYGYVYLHPLRSIKEGKGGESIPHPRYARMYASATGRTGFDYKNQRGIYDHFAYMVVDFESTPLAIRDDIVRSGVPEVDLSIETFVDRIVTTSKARMLFWDVFD